MIEPFRMLLIWPTPAHALALASCARRSSTVLSLSFFRSAYAVISSKLRYSRNVPAKVNGQIVQTRRKTQDISDLHASALSPLERLIAESAIMEALCLAFGHALTGSQSPGLRISCLRARVEAARRPRRGTGGRQWADRGVRPAGDAPDSIAFTRHRTYTHSIGAVAVVGLIAAFASWRFRLRAERYGGQVGARGVTPHESADVRGGVCLASAGSIGLASICTRRRFAGAVAVRLRLVLSASTCLDRRARASVHVAGDRAELLAIAQEMAILVPIAQRCG